MTFAAERTYYENSALWDPQLYQGEQEARARLTTQWLPADVHTVLDAGCGNGVLTNQLQRQQVAIGLDRSFAALQWVTSAKCQGDLATLPFADNTFDALVSTEVLEHLPTPLFAQALNEMVRVTRRYLVVSTPYDEDLEVGRITCPYCGCRFHRNYHMRQFTATGIRDLFKAHPAVQLIKATGIFTHTIYGADRMKRVLRSVGAPFTANRAIFPDNLICPQCNYTSPQRIGSEVAATGAVRRRPRVGKLVNRFIPAKQSYRWWLALYVKTATSAPINERDVRKLREDLPTYD